MYPLIFDVKIKRPWITSFFPPPQCIRVLVYYVTLSKLDLVNYHTYRFHYIPAGNSVYKLQPM